MVKEILRTTTGAYTLKREHDGRATVPVIPAKYSPQDKYGKYRRMARAQEDAATNPVQK
jgi:rRNA maturation protein Nop10